MEASHALVLVYLATLERFGDIFRVFAMGALALHQKFVKNRYYNSYLTMMHNRVISNQNIITHSPMQQQLIEQTIQITPLTMNDVLGRITQQLGHTSLTDKTLEPIVKSLFYGLWNFDKMINQHNLSTQIAQILGKLPKKNAFMFLHAMMQFLAEKWNYIDHHRINKFMQLVRYLVKQGMRVSQKKLDDVLLKTVFNQLQGRCGITDHVIEIYFDTACEVFLPKSDNDIKIQTLPFQRLQIFEKLLRTPSSLESLRLHIIEKIYQKLKTHMVETSLTGDQNDEPDLDKALEKIELFTQHILQLAKSEEHDQNRKTLYTLIGFMKSDHDLVTLYIQEKNERMQKEAEKKKKKITKFKKQIIKQNKKKRKEKKKETKSNKGAKIISRPKFQFKAREQFNKIMEA